ncbi:hypothetical protein ACHAWF_012484 [Thalassiosira exigua]
MNDQRHRRPHREGSKRDRSRSASLDGGDEGHRVKAKKKQRKRDRHRTNRRYDNRSESSLSSASSRSSRGKRHSSKKKHRREKKHKKHKRRKESKQSKKKPGRSLSIDPPTDEKAPPGAHELASALAQLFDSYPAMSSLGEGGIPLLFVQLSRGTEYNLSQMPDNNLARLLGVVFDALTIHGMELGPSGAWKWINAAPAGGRQGGDGLALLRLTRALLNGVGFTLEKVQGFEDKIQLEKKQYAIEAQAEEKMIEEKQFPENQEDIRHKKRVERMTSQMLDRFDPRSTSESSLANELTGICTVLMEGETVQLDGIENVKLKATLEQLFQLLGLELVEMEDESEDVEGDGEEVIESGITEKKTMGYGIPDVSARGHSVASNNISEVLRVCRFRSSGGSEGAPALWSSNLAVGKGMPKEESSSDEDDGPAPLGTEAAIKASKRKRPQHVPNSNKAIPGEIHEGGREEWMMVPGEHDFLKGIQAGGSQATRGRTFKNEKNRGQSIDTSSGRATKPINPKILEEVSVIQKAYEQSRGPSLFDSHREKQRETKQQMQGKKDWKWSRDKNLDDGRRVDKNALHMVLGGASTELKSKFQGGFGR